MLCYNIARFILKKVFLTVLSLFPDSVLKMMTITVVAQDEYYNTIILFLLTTSILLYMDENRYTINQIILDCALLPFNNDV